MNAKLVSLVVLALGASLSFAQTPPSWPRFRGGNGAGIAREATPLPVHFGPERGVLWKTAVPFGLSSPCVWGDRIFLTGHDAKSGKLETLCLERQTGAILWRRPAPADKIEKVYKVNSPASATPTTDGRRVYVSFGSYGLLCYDFDGKEVWRRPLPTPRTSFGSATSPVVVEGLLLLNGQGKDLHLMALNPNTGETVWTTEGTPFPSDYPVPLLWKQAERTEVIVPGRGGMLSYDLKNGKRLWWVPGLSPEADSSPIVAEGLLFVCSHLPGGDPDLRMKLPPFEELLKSHDKDKDGKLARSEIPMDLVIFSRGGKEGVGEIRLHQMYWLFDRNKDGMIDQQEWAAQSQTPFNNSLLAIRPGGSGDISKTHIAWQAKRGIPEVPSPLYYKGRIYLVRNGGILTCLEAKSGKELYQARLNAEGMFYSSPVAGDGKVYVASDSGVVVVLRASERHEVLAENDLGESLRATPALVDGVIYVRTAGHLYAFGKSNR